MNALQAQVIQAVEKCYSHAEDTLARRFARPKVSFKQRGKIAGSAHLSRNELRFNPTLLQDNLAEFLQEVVPHEVSHLLCFQLYGRVQPHGPEWKGLMKTLFNLKGSRCHQMNTQKVEGKTFIYQCGCGDIKLSIRRHNKIERGQQQYQCRRCRQILTQKPAKLCNNQIKTPQLAD